LELCNCLGLHSSDSHAAAEAIVLNFGRLPKSRAALMSRF
jgi:hypothetical protein